MSKLDGPTQLEGEIYILFGVQREPGLVSVL